jgi:hypothetical protein
MQGNSSPPPGKRYEKSRALVIGNGESRAWFVPKEYRLAVDVHAWGCNAIYRDGYVDGLVVIDYAMQQEIYDSGYCLENPEWPEQGVCYFANWSIVPASIADTMFMGYDIPEAFIHRSKNRTDQCVISGKDPVTLHEKIETAIKMNPNLDMNDLRLKMEKDVGVWITYVESNDDVVPIDYPIGWSAGNTALHLASKNAEEVYVLGFDLSSYDQPLNNMYKGTRNYLPADAKGFSPDNWYNQMRSVFREFSLYGTKFYLVDSEVKFDEDNVTYITKEELCEELRIV